MNVSELIQLVGWFDKEISQKNVIPKYSELINLLSLNAQPNQPKQPFEAQKNELIDLLKNVTLDTLTNEQTRYLSRLGLIAVVGIEGATQIENILFRNSLDIATATIKISAMQQIVSAMHQRLTQLNTGLDGFVEQSDQAHQGILMRIEFKGDASLNNVVDFRDWANAWHEIGRGIAMANKQAPEDIQIVGASKGSIILDLVVALAIAKTTSKIVLEALNVADRVYEIRKKAEELRTLKLKNDKLASELENEAETAKDEGAVQIVNKLVDELLIKRTDDGEVVKALEKSVTQLVKFVTQGGVVDVVLPPEPVSDSTELSQETLGRNELRLAFKEIRKLENKLRLIETK